MEISYPVWSFIIALAAVINGLGIVRLLGGFADYLRRRHTLDIHHYWVFTALAAFQLMLHILLWWSILGVREAGTINYLTYIYLLTGPTLLFLSTSFMTIDAGEGGVDLRQAYRDLRKPYYSLTLAFWVWAIFLWPLFVGHFAPTIRILIPLAIIALVLRLTENLKVHAAGVVLAWGLYVLFIAIYAMQLGSVGRSMVQ